MSSPSSQCATVEVHAVCWNEAARLPLFLAHYSAFASKIVVWDNHSTDGSREMVRRCEKAELRTYGLLDRSSERKYIDIKNNAWKSTNCEWVIVCDIDELVVCRNPAISVSEYLAKADGISVARCKGFDVFGRIGDAIDMDGWRVTRSEIYDKPSVFRRGVGEINYGYGGHVSNSPAGVQDSDLVLLHCRYLGAWHDTLRRYRDLAGRQSDEDVAAGCATRYRGSDREIILEYCRSLVLSVPISEILTREVT